MELSADPCRFAGLFRRRDYPKRTCQAELISVSLKPCTLLTEFGKMVLKYQSDSVNEHALIISEKENDGRIIDSAGIGI